MPKAKKPKPTAFLKFTEEWQKRNAPHLKFSLCIVEAGKIWEDMSPADRLPYENKAKSANLALGKTSHAGRRIKELRTCDGELVDEVKKRVKQSENKGITIKRTIDQIVRSAVQANDVESTNFYFVMINYFVKTSQTNVYVPAELAVSEFSLESGVNRVYHTHVNPGYTPPGQLYQMQQHCEATHKLPLPPKALGQTDFHKIHSDIIEFLKKYADGEELPPMYTTKEAIPVVESAMKYLRRFDAPEIRIYPIEYLLYVLKGQICCIAGLDGPESQFITDAYFEKDQFEYETSIGCEYHEHIDRTKYCAQSYVTRWGYAFAGYMCMDMAIFLKPGRHKPDNTKTYFVVMEPEANEFNDEKPNINQEERRNGKENDLPNDDVDSLPSSAFRGMLNSGPFNKETTPMIITKSDLEDIRAENYNKNVNSDESQSFFEKTESRSPSRMPSPPPAPLNLDFGYCNTVVELEGNNSSPRSRQWRTSTSTVNSMERLRSPRPNRRHAKRSTSRDWSPRRDSSKERFTRSPNRARRVSNSPKRINRSRRSPSLQLRRSDRSTSRDRLGRDYRRDHGGRRSPSREREHRATQRASKSRSPVHNRSRAQCTYDRDERPNGNEFGYNNRPTRRRTPECNQRRWLPPILPANESRSESHFQYLSPMDTDRSPEEILSELGPMLPPRNVQQTQNVTHLGLPQLGRSVANVPEQNLVSLNRVYPPNPQLYIPDLRREMHERTQYQPHNEIRDCLTSPQQSQQQSLPQLPQNDLRRRLQPRDPRLQSPESEFRRIPPACKPIHYNSTTQSDFYDN